MNKVLVISYSHPKMNIPSSIRIGKFAKYLPDYGWESYIVTRKEPFFYEQDTSFDYPQLNVFSTRAFDPAGLTGFLWGRKSRQRSLSLRSKNESRIDRIRSLIPLEDKIGWLPFAYSRSVKLIRKHDFKIIFTSLGGCYHQAVTACKLSRKFGIPYVLEFRDLWLDHPFSDRTSFNKALIGHYEKKVVQNAAHIVVVSRGFKNHLQQKYGLPDQKLTVLTNGFDPDDFDRHLEYKHDPKSLTMTFAGSFYRELDPGDLYRALASVQNPDIRIRIRFLGSYKSRFLELTDRYRIPLAEKGVDVEILPRQKYHDMLDYLSRSDLLLVFLPPGDPYLGILPSKIFDYLPLRRPVLAFCGRGGDLHDLVKKTGCGFTIESGNPDAGRKVLTKIFSLHRKNRLSNHVIDDNALGKFDRRIITGKLSVIFNRVMEG